MLQESLNQIAGPQKALVLDKFHVLIKGRKVLSVTFVVIVFRV